MAIKTAGYQHQCRVLFLSFFFLQNDINNNNNNIIYTFAFHWTQQHHRSFFMNFFFPFSSSFDNFVFPFFFSVCFVCLLNKWSSNRWKCFYYYLNHGILSRCWYIRTYAIECDSNSIFCTIFYRGQWECTHEIDIKLK